MYFFHKLAGLYSFMIFTQAVIDLYNYDEIYYNQQGT